jgi:hypothetical protein
LFGDVPILTPRALKVAAPTASGESYTARVEVIDGLLLNGVGREGRDQAIDKGVESAALVFAGTAPAQSTIPQQAASLAGQAAHSVSYSLL